MQYFLFTKEHRESQAIHGTLRLSTRQSQTRKGSREPESQKFGLEHWWRGVRSKE